jgi:replicative DNA helicase
MQFGEMLISKIMEDKNKDILTKYDLKRHHFMHQNEREAFDFITEYLDIYRQLPDPRTLLSKVKNLTLHQNVEDSYDFLAEQVKGTSSKVQISEMIKTQAAQKMKELSGQEFIDWMLQEAQEIKKDTQVAVSLGNNFADLKTVMKDEYLARKNGDSTKTYKTPFTSLNDVVEGFQSSDLITILGESGRGKTFITLAFIDSLLRQGANILVKSYEVRSYLWLSRLMSILTAKEGKLRDEYRQKVGLANKRILAGKLTDSDQAYFFEMLDKLNGYYKGNLHLQAKADPGITRTLADLDRELTQHPEIDVVVIDPFYGLEDCYSGKNNNRTAGGSAEAAARQLEYLAGKHDVVMMTVVQATVEKQKQDENNKRELKLPKRDQVKTTKAILEASTLLFSWDSVDGIAKIGIEKGRNGGEGFELELVALLDYGVIKEPSNMEALDDQFDTEGM